MKKFNLLMLFFLFSTAILSYGQSKESLFDKQYNSIIIAPVNVFDFINPSLQIGYERMLNQKIALQIEGAYILNHSVENYLIELASGLTDCEYTKKGFKVRGEFKYYFKKVYNSKSYVSGELFYLKNISKVSATFMISDPNFPYPYPLDPGDNAYNEFFTLDKRRFGLNLKIGSKNFIDKHIFIEPHIGIGLVYRISKHYGRTNPNDELYDNVLNFDVKAGNEWILNLPINIKVGYSF